MGDITVQKLSDRRFLNLFLATEHTEQGERHWEFASRKQNPQPGAKPQSDAVVIVPVLDDRLVTTSEYRVPLGLREWGFPAGLIEPNEPIEDAVARELKEEVGLSLVRIIAATYPVTSSAGMTDETATMVFVEASGTPSTDGNEDGEDIIVHVMDVAEVRDLILSKDKVISCRAWPVFYMVAAMGRVAFPEMPLPEHFR